MPVGLAEYGAVDAGHRRDGAANRVAQAVDQDVDAAERFIGLVAQYLHLGDAGGIRAPAVALASEGLHLSRYLRRGVATQRRDDDVRAGLGHDEGDTLADAATGARDQHPLAGDVEVVEHSSSSQSAHRTTGHPGRGGWTFSVTWPFADRNQPETQGHTKK